MINPNATKLAQDMHAAAAWYDAAADRYHAADMPQSALAAAMVALHLANAADEVTRYEEAAAAALAACN